MILKSKETIVGYRCPYCGTAILSVVGIFMLSGDLIKLKCTCGDSELRVEKAGRDKVKITVPCIVCPDDHSFTVSLGGFFEKDLVSLSCPVTGVGVCYIGREQAVRDALDKVQSDLDAMMKEAGYDDADDFEVLRHANDREPDVDAELDAAVRFVLSELKEDGTLHCGCASEEEQDIDFRIDGTEVKIFCNTCGKEFRIDLASRTTLEDFLLRTDLTLE